MVPPPNGARQFVPGRPGGILFVVSGPSGVGKDTVLAAARGHPEAPERCVTATTRAPREGEVDGVDYRFVSGPEFDALRAGGELLEAALVHGNWYGVPRSTVDARLAAGSDLLLKIDVQGAATVRRQFQEAVFVFLLPPSWEELERRLRDRAADGPEEIERRLRDAAHELAERHAYAYWIVNRDVDEAAARLICVIEAERSRSARWRETGERTAEGR